MLGKRNKNRSSETEKEGRFATVPDSDFEREGEKATGIGSILFAVMLFAAVCTAALAVGYALLGSIRRKKDDEDRRVRAEDLEKKEYDENVTMPEKVVVLRLGKFNRIVGPGPFFVVPIVESCAMRVDTRVRVTTFGAEETLTNDLVPLDVDAVLFWMVWDAKAACTEVGDFTRAVRLAAQTALRDAIGRGSVAEVAIRREQLDRELKAALEEKVDAWGVTVLSVEVRDIVLPKELQDIMSLEAQAEQRKKARIILMEAEQDIAEILEEAGADYSDNDAALRLRAMHLLYESVRETGGTVVVPSSFSEGFGDVLPESLKGKMAGR